MKNLIDFVLESKSTILLTEALESPMLSKFVSDYKIDLKSAMKFLYTAKVDIQLSKLTDANVKTILIRAADSIDGKKLRKEAKNDVNVRLFFNNAGRCFNITVGEFTLAGSEKFVRSSYAKTFIYKTVHGAADEAFYIVELQNLSNATGLKELRENRNFSKKDALALANLSQLASSQKRKYREAAAELRKNRNFESNSVTDWLEKDVQEVITKFTDALAKSYAVQDFVAAQNISDDLNEIIKYTYDIAQNIHWSNKAKENIEKEDDDRNKKYYIETMNSYQIDASEKLNRIHKKLDEMTYLNELDK